MPNGWKGKKHTVKRVRQARTIKGETPKKRKAAGKKRLVRKKRK